MPEKKYGMIFSVLPLWRTSPKIGGIQFPVWEVLKVSQRF